jgi:hypothetical protein
VIVHLCFGGNVAGGSLPVEDLSSAWRATKSLYRLLTVQVRMGVETDMSAWLGPTLGCKSHSGWYRSYVV